jgi:glyoxylase-like metal-dependent hydrolase (beta-lactamase superfamily II)
MSRIQFTGIVLSLVLAVFDAGAQQANPGPQPPDFSKVDIKVNDLGHRTYMLEGQGGNITVAVADEGIFMVDSQFAPLHDKIKAAIATVTDKPVRYLIDTHFHLDHTGGSAAFAAEGATVVAQENVRKRLGSGTQGMNGNHMPPVAQSGLPTKVYGDELTLKLKGRTAELRHLPAAHTDGDTYVYFADANVLATGDLVSIGRYPNIDVVNGGNLNGMIAAANALLERVNDKTRIVPGHGPLAGKSDLLAYRDMLQSARTRMEKLIREGTSEDDVLAAKPFADFDAKFGANDQASQNFIRAVYRSLKSGASTGSSSST